MSVASTQFRVLVLAAVVADIAFAKPACAAMPLHSFDSNNQGWTLAGSNTDYGPPTIDSTNPVVWDERGNPGGALSVPDNYYSTWISAPAPFLGNQSDMFGQSISYDIRIRYTDLTSVPYPSVAIRGSTTTLLYTIATPPLDQWQRRVVTFEPNLWTVNEGLGSPNPGNIATVAQMQSVLGNLEHLYLLTEWRTGNDDTSMDNIGSGLNLGLQGDYNQNSVVDGPDYVLWRKQLGSVYTQTDYVIWRSHFGQTGGGGTLTAVPEATALHLALLSLAVSVLHGRRRRHRQSSANELARPSKPLTP